MVKGLLLHVLTAPEYKGRRNLVTVRKLIMRGDWEAVEALRDAGETDIPPAHGLLWTALANNRVFVNCGDGTPDGMRCDVDGNLWCGWGGGDGLDGVSIFNPSAKLIGRILLPERCANLCFGGLRRNRLFMAASQSLYALYVNTQGVQGG